MINCIANCLRNISWFWWVCVAAAVALVAVLIVLTGGVSLVVASVTITVFTNWVWGALATLGITVGGTVVTCIVNCIRNS